MPWEIKKGAGSCRPDQFAVVKKGTDESVGCHATEDAAKSQLAALYANVPDAKAPGAPKYSEPHRFAHVIHLSTMELDESTRQSWVQALPLGSYEHPVHGTIEITLDRVRQFAQNVKDKVRSQDLDIDYDHKKYGGDAAGWVQDAEARDTGLWILVEWTKRAAELIRDRAYRYFSPEFADAWEHPKSQQTYQDVLFGGAITNRPFLKDILPLNLSEVLDHGGAVPQGITLGGAEMDEAKRKALAAKLGLTENATEAMLFDALEAWQPPVAAPVAPVAPVAPIAPVAPVTPELAGEGKRLTERDLATFAKLAEGNEGVSRLVQKLQDQQRELDARDAALRMSEVNRRLDVSMIGKDYALSPVVKDDLRDLLLEVPRKFTDKIYSIVEKLTSGSGLIQLGEAPGRSDWRDLGGTASARFNALVEDETKKGTISYADAVETVASRNPKLFDEYRVESTAFVE